MQIELNVRSRDGRYSFHFAACIDWSTWLAAMETEPFKACFPVTRFHTNVYACKSLNPSLFHFINKIPLETHTTSFRVFM